MKNRKTKIASCIILVLCAMLCCVALTSCYEANVVEHNIQKSADRFDVYRKMTFVNLQTGEMLYSAEGYFSLQTTVSNSYQGQQEIGLIFKTGDNSYQMHYFSINNNVAYVIEQVENTTTDPYHWKITWYVPVPVIG